MRIESASTNTGVGRQGDRQAMVMGLDVGRLVSTAKATMVATSTGSLWSRTLPPVTREISSRSSTNWPIWRTWWSTTSRAQHSRGRPSRAAS